MTCATLDRDLDAYVDRELAAQADAAVGAHLETCPRCAALVRERHALTRLVQAVPYYEAPAGLRARVARQASRTDTLRRFVAAAAAAVLVVAAGATGVRLVTRNERAGAEVAVDQHVRALAGARLFDVRSTDQHTVKPWFAGKLDFSPTVVDLASIGYPLAGGRVDALQGRAVAALVYQRREHVINLFVEPAGRASWARRSAWSVRGFQVRRWTSNGMTFWAVSDLNDTELAEFARALGG
jgi:anti-sigma factor RsiW